MRHERKYVVGYKGTGFVYDASQLRYVYPETWKEAVDIVENGTLAEAGDVVEVYALVPVAAWKCVKGKDGTRRMVAPGEEGEATAESAPRAICRAALAAVRGRK